MGKRGFQEMLTRGTLVLLAAPLMTMSAIAQNTFPATGEVGIGTTAPREPGRRFALRAPEARNHIAALPLQPLN
jgi:hypothetical protein